MGPRLRGDDETQGGDGNSADYFGLRFHGATEAEAENNARVFWAEVLAKREAVEKARKAAADRRRKQPKSIEETA